MALEAEDAVIADTFLVVRDEAGTSGGRILVQPDTIQSAGTIGEDAYLAFPVERADRYFLWARVKGKSKSEDAIYVGFNNRLERIYPEVHGAYVWLPVTFEELEPGDNIISVGHAEPEMSLDAVVVTTRGDLAAQDLEAWLLSDTLPAMPDPSDPGTNEEPEPAPQPEPQPAPQPEPQPAPEPAPSPAPSGDSPIHDRSGGSLRGDTSFKVASMPAEAQVWYRRLWEGIESPYSSYDAEKWAKSDDLYVYARSLHTHLQTLLTAFRLTGDLKLLDEIDRLVEFMRAELHDSWRGTLDGSKQQDGYLNWVWGATHADDHTGKDINKLDEMKTHSIIAAVAWALEENRDLKSPAGRNYGAHADFWVDYLVNDFEAKWRERENEPSGFPIMTRPDNHTYYSWTKWHYYMAKLTGKSAYAKEATRMANVLWDNEIFSVSTPTGTAYVWNKGVLSLGGSQDYLEPTTYARYTFADTLEFYFEGFHKWANEETLRRATRTIATWVIDREGAERGTDWFAKDIGGGVRRAGIDPDPKWGRMDIYRWESSPYVMLMHWDATDRMRDITDKAEERLGGPEAHRTVYIPAGHLVDVLMSNL